MLLPTDGRQHVQGCHFKVLILGHTYNANDKYHEEIFEILNSGNYFTLPEIIQHLQDNKSDIDVVVVQRIYDWATLAAEHVRDIANLFNLNRYCLGATVSLLTALVVDLASLASLRSRMSTAWSWASICRRSGRRPQATTHQKSRSSKTGPPSVRVFVQAPSNPHLFQSR
jgi:hypothetical protein